jgi:hypothetical protein
MKWEYKVEQIANSSSLPDRVHTSGVEGWELVSVVSFLAKEGPRVFNFYFKRPEGLGV